MPTVAVRARPIPGAARVVAIHLVALALVLPVAPLEPVAGADAGTSPSFVAVVGGSLSTCAVATAGTAWCWGSNAAGQLGDGTTTSRIIPGPVAGITTATGIAAGDLHACAVLAGGGVRCWGFGGYAQLGNGSTANRTSPVAVTGISTAVAVAAGGMTSCALLAGGAVRCWGFNGAGQVGDGTQVNRATPVAVAGLTDAIAVAVGGSHACAVRAGGTVVCWGTNDVHQLGAGTDAPFSSVPVPVGGLTGVTALDAGREHTCAVTSGGVTCWGGNGSGQAGGTGEASVPRTVEGVTDAVGIAAGAAHTCALLDGGAAACWGDNGSGELGDGTTTGSPAPVAVSGLASAGTLGAGDGHTCAIGEDASLACWGRNALGQLGDRTIVSRSVPTAVSWAPDDVDPTATRPRFEIRTWDVTTSRVWIGLRWSGADDPAGTGIDHYTVQKSLDGGAHWKTVALEPGTTRVARVALSGTVRYRVRAVDRAGNVGAWATSATVAPRLIGQSAPTVAYRGAWTSRSDPDYLGGSLRWTKTAGASATFTFTGRAVGLATTRSPSRGSVRVYLDGAYVETVSFQDATTTYRQIGWAHAWTSSGTHTLRLVAVGTAGHPRVDIDGFVVLR